MSNFTLAPDVAENLILAPAIRQTKTAIDEVLAGMSPTPDAIWEFQQRHGPRELVLRLSAGEKQSEASFRPSELIGNGAFKQRVREMANSLAQNGEWRVAAGLLIADARKWCTLLPDVKVAEDTVTLNEEKSGPYQLPRLTLASRTSQVRIEPVGGSVMTPKGVETRPSGPSVAAGRVDLLGPGGPFHLYFLTPEKWWLYRARDLDPAENPNLFYELDAKSFLSLVKACFDA